MATENLAMFGAVRPGTPLPLTETETTPAIAATSAPIIDSVRLRSAHLRTSAETGETRGYFWAEVTAGGGTRPVKIPINEYGGANWFEAARAAYALLEGP